MPAWGTGGSYGYRPWVMTGYATAVNPLATKSLVRSADAVRSFRMRLDLASARAEARDIGRPAARRLLADLARTSSTIEQRDQRLSKALEDLSPGASGRVELKATHLLREGLAASNVDALEQAIASEMSPLGGDEMYRTLGDTPINDCLVAMRAAGMSAASANTMCLGPGYVATTGQAQAPGTAPGGVPSGYVAPRPPAGPPTSAPGTTGGIWTMLALGAGALLLGTMFMKGKR